jgi:hypothetical protein
MSSRPNRFAFFIQLRSLSRSHSFVRSGTGIDENDFIGLFRQQAARMSEAISGASLSAYPIRYYGTNATNLTANGRCGDLQVKSISSQGSSKHREAVRCGCFRTGEPCAHESQTPTTDLLGPGRDGCELRNPLGRCWDVLGRIGRDYKHHKSAAALRKMRLTLWGASACNYRKTPARRLSGRFAAAPTTRSRFAIAAKLAKQPVKELNVRGRTK